MSGYIKPIPPEMEALKAVVQYVRKFPFVKDMFGSAVLADPAVFTKKFRVKLYKFLPEQVFYTDNRIRFGFRREVIL